MSFVFRAFAKNRRKNKDKNKGQPSNIDGITAGVENCELSSAHRSVLNKRNRPQQLLVVSQTDDDDDDKTHPLTNELSPSSSLPALPTAPHTPPGSSTGQVGDTSSKHNHHKKGGAHAATADHHSRKYLFKGLRKRADADAKQHDKHEHLNKTPDTAASSDEASIHETPLSFASSSVSGQPSPPTVKRGAQSRFSEVYMPAEPVVKKLTFHEAFAPKPKQISPAANQPPNLSCSKSPSQLKRGKRQAMEARRRQNQQQNLSNYGGTMNGGQSGTFKTVAMNGHVSVGTTMNASDTATTASAASSKARMLRREAERNARTAAALDTKGNELFEQGKFDKAMACYGKALKLKRRTFNHLLEEADDVEEQLRMCEEDNADPQILVSMATSINNIGYLRQRAGDATPEETMAAYEKSLRIKRRILGNDSLSVGKTLNNIGSVHYLKREFGKALPAYEEAFHIMKANLGEKHPDVATVMSNIGDGYFGLGNTDVALAKYRQALTIRWDTFGEKDPRVVRLLEKIAKIEMGDRMLTPQKPSSDQTLQAWDDASAASEKMELPRKPIGEELQELQQQIAKDIEHVNAVEQRATVEMLKDRIIIIRGMRAIWEGPGPELLDNDTASVATGKSLKSQA
eukprot:CAMPEP_0178739320 /NCGR_PEP_ID=MMETSP0744-20121128/3992_1 /TAXON_ID=913974 /ORGANISM="Nitzschia punctata, Strain CCMP561" /LENGTH=628 /DNA_ID=CAMNT_0020392015 /DNA_START=104 /DNA_END=1990 /DNA_ORIENTATION=+